MRKIHQSYFVVALCLGIVAGTILTLIFRLNFFSSPLWLLVSLVVMIVAYFQPRGFLLIFALGAGLILAFHKGSLELAGEDYIRQFYNQDIIVHGIIDGDPEADDGKIKFKLTQLKLGEAGDHPTKGNFYISLATSGFGANNFSNFSSSDNPSSDNPNSTTDSDSTSPLSRGDEITLSGKLTSGFGTYTGFMSRPKIIHWARPSPGNPVINVRNWFSSRIQALIPDPEQKLGLSYLLGMKSGLPEDLDNNLRMVGLVHIVVASGAHLSILVDLARKFFGKISRMLSIVLSIFLVIFFMAMVGWTPSIMRAGIMTILKLIAWYVGREFAAWRIILLVAAITLLINPMFIINLGWLLSFASFAGIMILGPELTKFFYGDKQPKFIASTIITTVSATLMTLPITLYYFGTLSFISIIANLLILPTLSYAMGLVFLTGVVANIPFAQTAVSFLATKLLDFHIAVVNFFGQMKSFIIEIEPEQPWVFALYFVILVPATFILITRGFKRYKLIHRPLT